MLIDLRPESGERPLFDFPWDPVRLLEGAAKSLNGPDAIPAQTLLFWCGRIIATERHLQDAKDGLNRAKRNLKP